MRGLLADVNVQGHLRYLRRLLEDLDLWAVLQELNLTFATQVAKDVADVLFGVVHGEFRDQSRIYVPVSPPAAG